MNNFTRDWEDFEFLTEDYDKGIVKYIEDNKPFFERIINSFPLGFHRIDWDRLTHMEILIKQSYPNNKEEIEKSVKWIFFKEKIKDETDVIICFDGYTKGALLMPVKTFVEHCSEILTTTQHSYVIPSIGNWCLNYTMEDYLYFGYAGQ